MARTSIPPSSTPFVTLPRSCTGWPTNRQIRRFRRSPPREAPRSADGHRLHREIAVRIDRDQIEFIEPFLDRRHCQALCSREDRHVWHPSLPFAAAIASNSFARRGREVITNDTRAKFTRNGNHRRPIAKRGVRVVDDDRTAGRERLPHQLGLPAILVRDVRPEILADVLMRFSKTPLIEGRLPRRRKADQQDALQMLNVQCSIEELSTSGTSRVGPGSSPSSPFQTWTS